MRDECIQKSGEILSGATCQLVQKRMALIVFDVSSLREKRHFVNP
jgi:hypothetical protein